MIVNINDGNRSRYNELFVESYKYLVKKGFIEASADDTNQSLSGLPEYYSHMNDFFSSGGWQFVFLPLDEEVFKIDLKDRSIEVPTSFKKQVSVQSDKLAETIVFSVARYFDYMDLVNTNIYVQWELPDGVTKNATRIRMIDTSTPGMLRFGWPISDIITKDPGTVKFSVRFFRIAPGEEDTQNMVYSLNTLEQSFKIAPAHQATLNDKSKIEMQDADLFKGVVINSNYYDVGVEPPARPEFLGNVSVFKKENGSLKPASVANLDDNTLTLYAEATVLDSGTLYYEWYCDDVNCADNTNKYKIDWEMIKFNAPRDTNNKIDWSIGYINGQRYFKALSADPDVTDLSSFERVAKVEAAKEEYLYRLYSTLTIIDNAQKPITGKYCAYAYNTIYPETSEMPGITSDCVLPEPNAVVLKSDLAINKNFINFSTDEDGDEIVLEPCTLQIEVDKKADSVDVLEYDWYYSSTSGSDGFSEMKSVSKASDSINANQRGWYKVVAKATANRAESDAVSSTVAKVTGRPVAPVFDNAGFELQEHMYDLNKITDDSSIEEKFELVLTGHENDPLYTDGITYQWYINKQDAIDSQEEIDNHTNVLPITKDMAVGYYHCVATNSLNGETVSTHSHNSGMVVTVAKL